MVAMATYMVQITFDHTKSMCLGLYYKRTKGPVAHLIDFLIVSLKVTMQSMVESHLPSN